MYIMTIQLHLSHTVVECETEFLNAAWQLQATIGCRLLGQKKIVTLLSGHLNGKTQLPNRIGLELCPSLTLSGMEQVFKSTNENNISIGISGLYDYLDYFFDA